MSDLGFVDRILELEGDRMVALKRLTINEDYLLDHFQEFPVMPGVLMTQALVETASWWLKAKTDFQAVEIVLGKVQNVKFANFLRPGETLRLEVENKELGPHSARFQAKGKREEKIVISLKFTLNYSSLRRFLKH